MKILFSIYAILVTLFSLVHMPVHAALVPNGNGTVYDDDFDLYFLQDPNYASINLSDQRVNEIIEAVGTIGNHELTMSDFQDGNGNYTGQMTWWGAQAWVDQLSFAGMDNWQLPTILLPDSDCTTDAAGTAPSQDSTGYNCKGSDLGHLFYVEIGASAGNPITTGLQEALDKFGIIPNDDYWSNGPTDVPLNFEPYTFSYLGQQTKTSGGSIAMAWPVHPATPTVPLPATLWLFGSGLLGLLGIARRKMAA